MFALLEKYWKPLVLIALVALSLWGFGHWRYTSGVEATNLGWSKKWSDRDATDAKAKAAEESRQRNIEQQRQIAAMEEGKRADEELAKAKGAAADAKRAGDSLQQQLIRLQKQFNAERATSSLSTAAAVSQARSEAVMVLTDVLGKSVQRNKELASTADDNFINGSGCERTYDKIAKLNE